MVEALIALPAFFAVALSLPLLHEAYAGKQRAAIAARSCALTHAVLGCAEPPAACSSAPTSAGSPDDSAATAIEQEALASGTSGFNVFEWVPGLGQALRALLGEKTRARARVNLSKVADRERAVFAEFVVLCNEPPRDVLQIASDVFCEHLPVLDCGG